MECNLKNEQLVAQIKAGSDRTGEVILMLWKQNQGIIRKYVNRYHGNAEHDDLSQEAFIALCSAVENYREDMGLFVAYLGYWLQHRLHRYCEKNAGPAHVPFHRYELLQKIRKASAEFEQTFLREPTRKELSGLLGVSRHDIDCAILADIVRKSTSIDKQIDVDGESYTLLDVLPFDADPEADAIDRELQREMREAIEKELKRLPAEQSQVIRLVYLEGKRRQEVGEIMNMPYNQIGAIIDKGFKQIRRRPGKFLRPFISEQALAIAYRGTLTSYKNTRFSATEKAAFRNMGISLRAET